jgi:glycosyltransferase involved in cell wall biosynthesis
MQIAVFGKLENSWGLEGLIKRAIETRKELQLFNTALFNQDVNIDWFNAHFEALVFIQGRGINRRRLKKYKGKKLLWNAEFLPYFGKERDPQALARLRTIEPLEDFDLVLNGCPLSSDFFRKTRGINMVTFPMIGVVRDVHRKLDEKGIGKTIDVGFYGSFSNRRKLIWRKLHDSVKKHKPGSVWVWAWPLVYGEDLVRFVNSCKIVLNIHFGSLLNTESRIYEVLGCGSFCLSELVSYPAAFLKGVHLDYGSLEELENKILYWLDREEEREEIAASGYSYVHSRYSMDRVLDLLIDQIKVL